MLKHNKFDLIAKNSILYRKFNCQKKIWHCVYSQILAHAMNSDWDKQIVESFYPIVNY